MLCPYDFLRQASVSLIGMKTAAVLLLVLCNFAFAASPAEERVKAYFDSFNSGEAEMEKYFVENIAEDSLQKRPIAQRLEFYRRLKSDVGSLTMQTIETSGGTSLKVTAAGERNRWVTIQFDFQPEPPHKITGMQVDLSEAPAAVQKEAKKGTEQEALSTLESYVNELTAKDEFSGVVLIAKDGKPVFQKAYGFASREYQVPNRIDTKFNLGSINKFFTQIAILQLIEKGKLSLDDTIAQHFPDYPNKQTAEKVKIKHLLEMTSGIGDFFGDKFESTAKNQFRNLSDFLFTFANEPLEFEPGTQNRYSNGGYIVLGLLIEKVSGRSYFDYVRENIFVPSGMQNTDSYEADRIVPNLAQGYTREGCGGGDCERRSNIYTRPARGSSAGGGYSTAEDLLKLTAALKSAKILSRKNADQVLARGVAGGAEGINAIFVPAFQGRYSIIVLVNEDPPLAETVGKKIRDWLPEL